MKKLIYLLLCSGYTLAAQSQILLRPTLVFDGFEMHDNWIVYVAGESIIYAGRAASFEVPDGVTEIDLNGMTLMPGLIEGHSHLLLHPYNETSWNDQVLKESHAERAIRGAQHARASLMSGITTMRDLGSEGAGYADVALKKMIDAKVIPGPRLLVAGPAIVATGAYGPKGFHEGVTVPLGAESVSGVPEAIATVRRQMGGGVDLVKIYSDYRWSLGAPSQPTFLQEELEAMVATATTAGKYVVAHAATEEGMKRAILAGIETIEHGDSGTSEVFQLMKNKGVVLYPTLAAGDAIERYNGWSGAPDTERIIQKKKSFMQAMESGVTIGFGGDVGVFPHGENYRELELMSDYGMLKIQVLRAATSINAKTFHLEKLGWIKSGYIADLIAVPGNPEVDIKVLRQVKLVIQGGNIVKNEIETSLN